MGFLGHKRDGSKGALSSLNCLPIPHSHRSASRQSTDHDRAATASPTAGQQPGNRGNLHPAPAQRGTGQGGAPAAVIPPRQSSLQPQGTSAQRATGQAPAQPVQPAQHSNAETQTHSRRSSINFNIFPAIRRAASDASRSFSRRTSITRPPSTAGWSIVGQAPAAPASGSTTPTLSRATRVSRVPATAHIASQYAPRAREAPASPPPDIDRGRRGSVVSTLAPTVYSRPSIVIDAPPGHHRRGQSSASAWETLRGSQDTTRQLTTPQPPGIHQRNRSNASDWETVRGSTDITAQTIEEHPGSHLRHQSEASGWETVRGSTDLTAQTINEEPTSHTRQQSTASEWESIRESVDTIRAQAANAPPPADADDDSNASGWETSRGSIATIRQRNKKLTHQRSQTADNVSQSFRLSQDMGRRNREILEDSSGILRQVDYTLEQNIQDQIDALINRQSVSVRDFQLEQPPKEPSPEQLEKARFGYNFARAAGARSETKLGDVDDEEDLYSPPSPVDRQAHDWPAGRGLGLETLPATTYSRGGTESLHYLPATAYSPGGRRDRNETAQASSSAATGGLETLQPVAYSTGGATTTPSTTFFTSRRVARPASHYGFDTVPEEPQTTPPREQRPASTAFTTPTRLGIDNTLRRVSGARDLDALRSMEMTPEPSATAPDVTVSEASPQSLRRIHHFSPKQLKDIGPQMQVFLAQGETDVYKGYKHDQWLLAEDGDLLIHLEDDVAPTLRLDSRTLMLCELEPLSDALMKSKSSPDPKLDVEPLRQSRPNSLPLHMRVSPIKWPGVYEGVSAPDITAGMAAPKGKVYRMYTPALIGDIASDHDPHLVFRNLLGLVYGAPQVGKPYADLFTTLKCLADVVESLWRLNKTINVDSVGYKGLVIEYVKDMGYIEITGNLQQAQDMLAWCELPNVQWAAGYREAFANFVGITRSHDWADIMVNNENNPRISKKTIDRLHIAWSSLGAQINHAEQYLREFSFPELTDRAQPEQDGVKMAFNDFKRVLKEHYSSRYMSWPPLGSQLKGWLSKSVAQELLEDMCALYDYLVDRRVTWQELKEDFGIQNQLRPKSRSKEGIPDTVHALMLLTAAVQRFDSHRGADPMPLPCPLMPSRSITFPDVAGMDALLAGKDSRARIKKRSSRHMDAGLAVQVAFATATRSESLDRTGEERVVTDLLRKFQQLESSCPLPALKLEELQYARLGRWMLVYGIMQAISTLCVEPYYNAVRSDRAERVSSSREYFVWGAIRACPPWVDDTTSVGGLVFDMERAVRQTHSWQRHMQLFG